MLRVMDDTRTRRRRWPALATVVLLAAGALTLHGTSPKVLAGPVVPAKFVENLRLNEAKRRLASRRKALQSVATSVGFADAGTFRRSFEKRFGEEPGRCFERAEDLSPVS